jgi:hypothetical protein
MWHVRWRKELQVGLLALSKKNRQFGRSKEGWKNMMDPKEIGSEDLQWIDLAQHTEKLRAVVSIVNDMVFHQILGAS